MSETLLFVSHGVHREGGMERATCEVVERVSRALISTMGAGGWSSKEHRAMFEAIRQGEAEKAARLAQEHVSRGGSWIIEQMEKEGLEL